MVAFVGVTLFRVVSGRRPGDKVPLGLQPDVFEGARVFVLPNPSGRNANFSYQEMLGAFRALAVMLREQVRGEAGFSGRALRYNFRSTRKES